MVKGSNNYFNAVPTSDILDSSSNADIPIAETVVAHPLGGGDCSHHISSSADDGGQNVADPSFTIDEDDTMPAAANGKNGNNVIMVEITAPANLHEGYKFDAFFNGVSFPVIVPAGGCRKGQILVVPFNPNASNGTPNAWKDGILACTRYGIFHPSFLCAWCCPLILLGQIMTRLKMDWAGHVSPRPDEWKKTFRTLLLLGLFKYALIDDQNREYLPVWSHVLHSILLLLYALYLIFLLIRVRRHVRDRDGIPEERHCGKFEDCCMAWLCPCCTVSQLARQTANYDIEIGYFLTQDGLAPPSDDCYDNGNGQGDSMVV